MLRSILQLMNCSGTASRKEVSTSFPTFGSEPPTSTTSQKKMTRCLCSQNGPRWKKSLLFLLLFQCMPTHLPHQNSFKHVLTPGRSSQVNKPLPGVCIHLTVLIPVYSSIHALFNRWMFLHIDVIGVITAISNIGTTQTKLRQGNSTKRTVTIQTPR